VLFELYAGNKHPTQNTTAGGSFLGLANGCTLWDGFTPVVLNTDEIGAA